MRRLAIALALLLVAGPAHAAALWLTDAEVAQLPMSGTAWNTIKARADLPLGTPNVSDQDDNTDVYVLAKALIYKRTGTSSYRTDVISGILAAINTESDPPNNPNGIGNRTLALGRNLPGYVIAAQLVGLSASDTAAVNSWLRTCLTETMESTIHLNLVTTHEQDPNNWGTTSGAARVAVCAYLGLTAQLAHCDSVFHGWTGDSASWDAFQWDNDLTWQANPASPRAINPQNSRKNGVNVDGALPEEMRRGGSFVATNPGHTGYPWEGLQGAVLQAGLLSKQGYDSWNYENKAILRAVAYLKSLDEQYGSWYEASTDDRWVRWMIDRVYEIGYPVMNVSASSPGKNMSWTDWTHGSCTCSFP